MGVVLSWVSCRDASCISGGSQHCHLARDPRMQILELVQGRTVDLTIRFSRKQMGVVLPQQDGGA